MQIECSCDSIITHLACLTHLYRVECTLSYGTPRKKKFSIWITIKKYDKKKTEFYY